MSNLSGSMLDLRGKMSDLFRTFKWDSFNISGEMSSLCGEMFNLTGNMSSLSGEINLRGKVSDLSQ